ncbi:MAG: hypothetical protein P8Q23_10215, partial [Paracoccaceae bacterium]|nr:hypothetical protein [Paracoccaceae bacterium]
PVRAASITAQLAEDEAAIGDFFAQDEKARTKASEKSKAEPPTERLYNWLYGRSGTWVPRAEIMAAVGLVAEEFDKAVDRLIADGDVMRRDQGDETLFRAKR